jgi:hypothetical protein
VVLIILGQGVGVRSGQPGGVCPWVVVAGFVDFYEEPTLVAVRDEYRAHRQTARLPGYLRGLRTVPTWGDPSSGWCCPAATATAAY